MGQHWEHETEGAIYFWGGILSNWAKYQFDALLPNADRTASFTCVEQYMMASKAVLFGDTPVFEQIMHENNPRKQKALGRQVKGYNDEEWRRASRDVVYTGAYAKFDQNLDIRDLLLSTNEKMLVEASLYDTVWGIGLAPFDHGVEDVSKWRGTNWLGQVLMQVRTDLRSGAPTENIQWDL